MPRQASSSRRLTKAFLYNGKQCGCHAFHEFKHHVAHETVRNDNVELA
jgi:hypothetical protein